MEKASVAAQFKVGDKAVYPGHGVAQITGVERREIAGTKKEFYVLKTLDSDIKLLIPIDGAKRAGLRGIIGKKEVEKVLEILKDRGIAVASQPWNRRQREYTEMLNSGSIFEVAKVLRDLHRPKSGKEISYSERRLRDQARGLLVSELALACDCDISRAEKTIDEALGLKGDSSLLDQDPSEFPESRGAC